MDDPVTQLDERFSDPGTQPTTWAAAREALEAAQLSWISTVRADGRPHVTPLVAVWFDGAAHFTTGATEQKAVNLAANPSVVLTTGYSTWDKGLDVMVEGFRLDWLPGDEHLSKSLPVSSPPGYRSMSAGSVLFWHATGTRPLGVHCQPGNWTVMPRYCRRVLRTLSRGNASAEVPTRNPRRLARWSYQAVRPRATRITPPTTPRKIMISSGSLGALVRAAMPTLALFLLLSILTGPVGRPVAGSAPT